MSSRPREWAYSLVALASVPSRNNPVTGGVLFGGAAGEMPAAGPPARAADAASGAVGEGIRVLGDGEVTSV